MTSGDSSSAPSPVRQAPGAVGYTVQKGDSLSKIAKAYYGDAGMWPRIYEANRDLIKDPDLIYPGQTLTIPTP